MSANKKFLYLIQAESGIPEHIQDLPHGGNDIIALSWKKPAKDTIFFPNSTWTEGRNRLFEETKNTDYLYYIFMDEDCTLAKTEFCSSKKTNPWRVFEDYLMKYMPAVGLVHTQWQKVPKKEAECVYHFDASITAFHKEAINHLLPYYPKFDGLSWWYSQIFVNHQAAMLYKNHVIQFGGLEAINRQHRKYPKAKEFRMIDKLFLSFLKDSKGFVYHEPLEEQTTYGEIQAPPNSYHISKEKLSKIFKKNEYHDFQDEFREKMK